MRTIVVAALNNEDISWLTQVVGWQQYVVNILQPPGREAYAILSYIESNYDELLPEQEIVFCQGFPFAHDANFLTHLECPDNHFGLVTECDKFGRPHYTEDLNSWCNLLGIESPAVYHFSAGAQYRVTGLQILSRPLELYKAMLSLTYVNPKTPWVYERLWPIIWGIPL